MKTFRVLGLLAVVITAVLLWGCEDVRPQNSDTKQADQQEKILAQGTATIGMPAITNFRERKLLKMILELRDNEKYITWTYTRNDMTGKFNFLGKSIGYPLPYSTQFTNPQKVEEYYRSSSSAYTVTTLPQADPNGLFSPSSAEGTWVMLIDPKDPSHVAPVYCEPKVTTFPWRLPDTMVEGWQPDK